MQQYVACLSFPFPTNMQLHDTKITLLPRCEFNDDLQFCSVIGDKRRATAAARRISRTRPRAATATAEVGLLDTNEFETVGDVYLTNDTALTNDFSQLARPSTWATRGRTW